MNVLGWSDNYIDATNEIIGGSGDTIIEGGTGNISDYLYVTNNSNVYLNNPNTDGEIRIKVKNNDGNPAYSQDHRVRINKDGKLQLYHVYNPLIPTYPSAWYDISDEVIGLKFNSDLQQVEIIALGATIAVIQGQISDIYATLTTILTALGYVNNSLEFTQDLLYENNVLNQNHWQIQRNRDNFNSLLEDYVGTSTTNGVRQRAIENRSFIANSVSSITGIYGLGLQIGVPVVSGLIGALYAIQEDRTIYNAASNISNINFEITTEQRRRLLDSNLITSTSNIINLASNLSNMSLEQGFINSSNNNSQLITSLKSNKILLGNITTPNSSYQMEMTGDLNLNELYINSTSLSSLLNQKQNNMSATQPIFITTANIGLNYDSSLTKVGNNLSVVKTATAPLKWTGNDISLDYDSTLLNNSGSLGVSISAESKWLFTGANIYNKALTNVGIGTNSGLTYKFNVRGDTYLSSNLNIAQERLNFISSFTGASLTAVTGTNESYLQYTTNGTLILNEPCACDLLIVGGGGNGGTGASSGGGGGGEVIYFPNFPLRNGTLNINVGTSSTTPANRISSITHSSGTLISAKGGGNGGYFETIKSTTTSTVLGSATALINYTNTCNLTTGSYTTTFATGAIDITGFNTDKSYPILKDGSGNIIQPRAWYKFDVGALLTDSGSTGGFTLVNGYNVTNNTTSFVKGDASANLNGTDNFFYGGGGGSWNISGVDFTVAFWSYRTANNVNMSLFQFGDVAATGQRLICFYQSDNKINWGLYGKENPTTNAYSDANSWIHLVFAFNQTNKTIKYYYNGSLVDTITTVNATTNFSGNNWIGYSSVFNRHNGRIDDFRIYLSELTATQASELYSGRVDFTFTPTSGGCGGGGAKSQTGAIAGVKFDDYKSYSLAGLNGNSTTGGNGGSGNTTYNTRYTTTITGSSLSVALGGSGVGTSGASPTTKSNYGDGGDGNGGVGFQGVVIIRFKEALSYLQLKAIKDNANNGLILNANETPNVYQLRVYPWSDTYQLTGIATRGWSMRCHDGNNHLDLLNLFSSFGGRVGIKTKNPSATFDVNGDINCKTFSVVGSEQYGITCQVVNQHDTGEASINISAGASGNYGAMSVVYLPSENLGYINCSKSLQIKTQSIGGYIHIDNSTGYVGIGNNLPQAKLHVSGTILSSSISVTTVNANSIAAGNISCTSLDLNNGSIIDCNRLNSVDVWTGPIKATSLDLDGGNITNGGFFYGMAQQARFFNMSTGEWHYDTQSRNRFYFTNDGTSSHTVFRTGSTTHYFQDKDGTDYCLLDRFGISTYFEVISGGGYDNLGVTDASVTGVYVYRKMLVRLSTFTEVHRCFCEDDLYSNYDDFINEFIGRVVISKGKIKTALKEAGKDWQILEGNEGITIDDSHAVVELSRKSKDKRVLGVITKRNQNNDLPGRLVINSLGETAIWIVNTGGNIENGDLITTSDELGYGQKQDCDFIKNYTIGKSIIDCSFELNNPNYKCEVLDYERNLRRAFLPIFIYSG